VKKRLGTGKKMLLVLACVAVVLVALALGYRAHMHYDIEPHAQSFREGPL